VHRLTVRLLALALGSPPLVFGAAPRLLSNADACQLLIDAFPAESLHSDETMAGAKPWCDRTPGTNRTYFIFGLHSDRRCDYICSSLVGWFAVERATGRVFDWDISEDVVGRVRWDGNAWFE